MWSAGSAFSWYVVLLIISSNYCWTWRFAYFVEFKTFTITVPVCPLTEYSFTSFIFNIFKHIFNKNSL